MKKQRHTEEQIAFILKQVELGALVAEVCRKTAITEQAFYRWKMKYGGMLPSNMKRLSQLEEENSKLKKLVADPSLDKGMLQDVLSKQYTFLDSFDFMWNLFLQTGIYFCNSPAL